jgi:hypothetical protein
VDSRYRSCFAMSTKVALAIVAAALAGLQVGVGSDGTSAAETYSPPYLWENLRPGGTGQITYTLCPEGLQGEANWGSGVETWDDSLGPAMNFDALGGCSGVAQTTLRWEPVGTDPCGLSSRRHRRDRLLEGRLSD